MSDEYKYIIITYKKAHIMKELFFILTYFTIAQSTSRTCGVNQWSGDTNCDPRCHDTNGCAQKFDNNYCCYSCQSPYVFTLTASNYGTCTSQCVPGQYSNSRICTDCHDWCSQCTGNQHTDCTSCTTDSYQFDLNTCYLNSHSDNSAMPYSQNPCPQGYYGIYYTKKCQACPTGCLQCNIYLQHQMPSTYVAAATRYQMNVPCPGDQLCRYALKCYKCINSNYVLQEGFCISKNRCRRYSWYNSTASGFNIAYCYCKDNFYQSGTGQCSRCDYTCLTCDGPLNTDCLTCPLGQTVSGSGQCQILASIAAGDDTLKLITNDANIASAAGWTPTEPTASNVTFTSNCPPSAYVFGQRGYSTVDSSPLFDSGSLNYLKTGITQIHYAVRFRATFLFIDEWINGIGVIFSQGGTQVNAYYYTMQQIIGQYLCGRNFYDHHDVIDFTFPHSANSIDLDIQITHSGYAWGIKQAVIQLLLCDSTCDSCSGPLATDCVGCSATNQAVIDGQCECDISAGWFNDTSGCTQTCSSGYKNPVQRKCTATCDDFPYLFIQNGQCVQNCSATKYKDQTTGNCELNCYVASDANPRFKFDPKNGGDRVCYHICPDGYFGDPTTGKCVTQCPKNSGDNAGYFAEGKFCVQWCDNSGYLAFHPTRTCVSACPAGFYQNVYTDSSNNDHDVCQQVCSVTLSGNKVLADNSTGSCVDYCPDGSYSDYPLYMCVKHCNLTAFEQEYFDGTRTVRSCQLLCYSDSDPTLSYYGNQITGKCDEPSFCPENQYGDPDTTFCTESCSNTNHFGDNTSKLCVSSCSSGFKQLDSKVCVATCPELNDAGNPQFGDPQFNSGQCVQTCTSGTFADKQHNRQCVPICSPIPSETYAAGQEPAQTFGLGGQCVYNCSASTWADIQADRKCVTSCSHTDNGDSVDSYGYNQTRSCLQTCPDTQYGIVISTIPVCVFKCQGTFGNPQTNLCVDQCPIPYYGDQSTGGNRSCVQQCPDGWFAENTTAAGAISTVRLCVQDCTYGWADDLTRTCAILPTGCSEGYYAHETDHICVLPTGCTGFADPTTQKCVPTCPFDIVHINDDMTIDIITYYGDDSTSMCVLICPENPDYFGDNQTHQCTTSCSLATQVKDPQHFRRCQPQCSRSPLALYADFDSGTCVTAKNCTAGKFSDNSTFQCESDCQDSILQYADEVSGQCVDMCQLNYYGYNSSANVGQCRTRCPLPQHADNLTVLCTDRCSTNTYGVNHTDPVTSQTYGTCQYQCPPGQYARDSDNLCVSNCGNGGVTGQWGNNQTRKCVTTPYDCPDGTYADSDSHNCVYSIDCSQVSGVQYVADNITQQCLSQCPDMTPTYLNWADMNKNLCVRTCPTGFYGYNFSKVCQTQCKTEGSSTYADQYADWQLNICVQICSAGPVETFGEDVTHTCVQALDCPGETWAEIEVNDRRCVAECPDPNQRNSNLQKYADNITKTCVQTCPTHFYGDLQRGYGMCVDVCPNTTDTDEFQFADNYSKTCVTVCPASQSTWGDVVSLQCVYTCPIDYFSQQKPSYSPSVIVRHCVLVCAQDSWGQIIQRTCVYSPTQCPTINGTHWYADNTTHLCVQTCPVDAANSIDTWGQNSTWACQNNCTTGFKYNDTRVCIDICPAGLDGDDGSFSDDNMCYYVCVTANYFRDVQNARSCQPTCSHSPDKYYADSTTMRCVHTCPAYPKHYYAYDGTWQCLQDCPLSTMRDPLTRKCVSQCPSNTFFDQQSDSCVERCPVQYQVGKTYYGDPTQAIPLCVVATDCPNTYFADDVVGLCVQVCSVQQWKYGKNCITHCPDGYYGNFDTGFCVIPADCPTDNYADNQTKTCVPVCNGTFADTNNKICVDICPVNYYSDPATGLCSLQCTDNSSISLHQNIANRTCVSNCQQYLFLDVTNNSCEATCPDPYFADRSTQICVKTCPSVPPLFGDEHQNTCVEQCDDDPLQYKHLPTRMCVDQCPSNYFRDNFTRFCVQYCVNVTYADQDSGYCVSNCTPKFSLDDPNICTSSCPLPYFRDSTTFKCVLQCPTHPQTYFKVVTSTDRRCDVDCPDGQYRDIFSFSCVQTCPLSPPTYADDSTDNCVTVCPTSSFADKDTRKCVSPCPSGMFATQLTQQCVLHCINGTDTYADDQIPVPACVRLCSPGTYADPYSLKCVDICGYYPKMYGFDNGTHRICLQTCPHTYYADNTTNTCVLKCQDQSLPYFDQASRSCVAECTSPFYKWSFLEIGKTTEGECLQYCPPGRFALMTNYSCITKCPDGLFGDIQNNTCYENCTQTNNKFADSTTNLCVPTCPFDSSYDSYGDLFSRKCVTQCPADKFTVADSNTRLCQPSCTLDTQYINPLTMKCVDECPDDPFMFADPISQKCVEDCSLYSDRYGYEGNRTCVQQCPDGLGLYANNQTRRCVTAWNCQPGTYGLDPERICVQICPEIPVSLFADPFDTNTCVQYFDCPIDTFAEPFSRMCVYKCPNIPQSFGYEPLQDCRPECPDGYWADNYTQQCVTNCSTGGPLQTYSDNSTNRCVVQCPSYPNYFASNYTFQCVDQCPSSPSMFADYSTRTCVYNCPGGDIWTFADSQSRQCVHQCPDGTFMQNSTRSCVNQCDEGYADPQTRYCIAVCPAYTYGYLDDRTCKTGCPQQTPQLYAEDNTNLCQSQCLEIHNTFADDTTNRCVQICPVQHDLYAQDLTKRRCVSQCAQSPFQLADFSTRTCVDVCPLIPSLYGQLDTRRCVADCPDQLWADNETRTCVDLCPDQPDTYGDNSTWTCVLVCPTLPTITYSDNYTRTCVPVCPQDVDYYADNATQRCVKHCSNGTFAQWSSRTCVQTCPQGQYGYNQTHRCIQTCPQNQFADHLLNLCVSKCSIDPIYYGNPDTHICVQQCPEVNNSFGNPLTQQCVNYFDIFSGCPDYLYSDNVSRLCVPKCPLLNDTYGDNSTWKCVSVCPGPTDPGSPVDTFSDNSTMMCVQTCPQYPEYYAQQYSRRCVSLCLEATQSYSGSFADNSTRKCVQQCPSDPDYYSDNSTRRCVLYCPQDPLTFADNSTRRCVSQCPSDPDIFGDPSTLRCVEQCPQSQLTYADNNTRLCVKVCTQDPPMYGQNDTNRCVDECPDYSFADNSSRLCVAVCPQYPDTYGDSSTNRCVSKCPADPDTYADPITQTCVQRCPDGYYAENQTRRCLVSCPMDKINYADDLTNRCVQRCPQSEGTYGDNSTQKCVPQCPDVPFTYADNMTRICLDICNNVTEGGWAENQTRVCVQKCPDQSFGDNFTRYCVRYCPDNYFGYPVDNVCVEQCPQPYFGDNSTQLCVQVCPVSQLLFGQSIDRTCTTSCPEGTYADSYSQQCLQVCPGEQYDTFALQSNNTCVHQCPIPLYGYPVTPYRCIDQCINPYYENITDHRCYKCPDQCEQCNYPQLCITCIADHFLYSGRCLESCPTFPVITYANPNRICGTAFECTTGYFAFNNTKSCIIQCPTGFYKNTTTQTCDSCLRGCSLCTNSSSCIQCNTTLAMWDDYTCHLYCSQGRRYYTSTGCASSCPDGTYLQLTTCKACSQICKRCIVQPQNCITCANGYYLSNNLCVSECPQNTKAVLQNGSLYCKSCDIVTCEQKPLTYEVEQFVDNYKYSFRLKFSEQVNITQQINNVIKIKQKTNRRMMQQIAYQTVDYTIYDLGNGQYVFTLNNFDTRQDSNMQFQLQIVNPEAIQSESGQFPESTRSTIVVQTKNFYSVEDYNTSISSYCQFVVIVSVILFVLTFWNNQAIWMPSIDFFQMIFALLFINVMLPPNPTYAFGAFKAITLNFLPNVFTDALPQPQYNSKSLSNTIFSLLGDTIFVRTLGHLFLILIILIVVMLVMLVIWKKGSQKMKGAKKYCKKFLKETFWKKHLHGLIYFFFLPVMLLSFMKMKDYSTTTAVQGFSIFLSFLFWLSMLTGVLFYTYKVIRLLRDNPSTCLMIQKGYQYISNQQVILDYNQIFQFKIQKNQISLKQLHMPRINELLILPYPIQTKFGKLQVTLPLIQYLYKLLVSVLIAIGFESGAIQMFTILILTIANFIYLYVTKPYIHIQTKQYNNFIALFNQAALVFILIPMIILKLQQSQIDYETRIKLGDAICGILLAAISINLIYFIYRTYEWYWQNAWKPFVQTELFKQNYTIQYWQYQKRFEKEQKQRRKKLGKKQEFLDAIKLTNQRDGLQNLIEQSQNNSPTKKKSESLEVKLRPNKNKQLKNQITQMFQSFNDEKQKSHKSLKSSQRLSKQDRNRVRNEIFKDKDMVNTKDNYQQMKIIELHEDEEDSSQSETQYEYQYIQEQYPEGTPMEQIMKNCKKGEFIMP